jgi:hypothetical protein
MNLCGAGFPACHYEMPIPAFHYEMPKQAGWKACPTLEMLTLLSVIGFHWQVSDAIKMHVGHGPTYLKIMSVRLVFGITNSDLE